MDNLTHTLVGALVAETAARVIPAVKSTLPQTTRRNLYLALMVVGSNLPDLACLASRSPMSRTRRERQNHACAHTGNSAG